MKQNNPFMLQRFLSIVFLATVLSASFLSVQAQDQSFEWVSIEDAVIKAEKENKKILIDFWAEWCHYCHKMDKEVYTDASIRTLIDKYFIPVKINTESENQVSFKNNELSEAALAYAFKVSSLPTTVFLNAKAEGITYMPGYLPAENFGQLLKYIGSDAYLSQSFDDYSRIQSSGK